ncbi:MAG: class I SAM-dependent methyltransferase [Spirochaetales bacterium]|nr:class I SAM-dependent methyltransferase [Spirochaetales bacterium]
MTTFDPEAGYDLYASSYKNDHAHLDSFDWELARAWIQEALLRADGPLAFLDAGCGDGRTLARCWKWSQKQDFAANLHFFGVDVSNVMLRLAAKRLPQAQFARVDLGDPAACRRWAGGHRPADLITAFFVLVHFPQIKAFFDAVNELSAAKARLIMNTIPQKSPPELNVHGHRFQIRAWHHEAQDVVATGEAQGWRLVRSQEIHEGNQLVSTLLWWEKI